MKKLSIKELSKPRCACPDCRTENSKIWYETDRALFCEKCYKKENLMFNEEVEEVENETMFDDICDRDKD